MHRFLEEIRRRNVHRVATTYALAAWILIEAGSVLLPTFGIPDSFFKTYVIIVSAGFAITLILSWVFEVTPDGIKLERNIDRSTYAPRSGDSKNYLIIGLLVVALGVSITFNVTGMRDEAPDAVETALHNSVAVLPFTSRSSIEENQFFADGIHEDILMRLAEIKSLRVISRTSVNEYRDTNRNLREIGEELGVSTIVVGTVQRADNQVRISVQLVDAKTDDQIWAATYDRELSIESLFKLQTEISSQIASSLRAALTPEQEIRLATIPTNSIEAYAEYVAGRENLLKRNFATLIAARQQFEHAIELDPQYAQAYASLAETILVTLSNHKSIATDEAFSLAATHLAEALRIDPGLPQAYAVRGLMEMMQWEGTRVGSGNFAAAASFEKAIELNPSLSDAYVWFASLRRVEGEIEDAVDLLMTALTLDPLSRIPYVNLPSLLAMEGRNERTTELLLHAINIFPEWATPYNYLSAHMKGLGRLDEAIAWGLKESSLSEDPMTGGALIGIYQDFGDDAEIMAFIESFPKDHPVYPIGESYWLYTSGDYEGSLAAIEPFATDSAFPLDFTYPIIIAASIMTRDFDRAYEYLLKSNPKLGEDAETTVDRYNLQSAILLAYVEQQRNHPQAAARLLQQAEPIVRSTPRLGMAGHGIRDVQLLTLQGRRNEAIEALTQAVAEGFVSSRAYDFWSFDEDPIIEPLRSDARFGELRRRMNERLEEMRRNVELAKSSGDWSALLAKAETV
ncbi:MAG: FlgO family outer membrane protein [Gammaproteobacteria bacterium]|nr:FlgO family outer membrane protein [Gammaproteobacteria bacterium]MDH5239193.1 FlgO family outer membrane protein [Gammaproteobacteria bacterium]MDH5260917.1 FlgO family outer membrane protein [Gammaproteobacteria bacterium]MDH5582436.1 FlgO family outer membrane protein [Gammaproteobacteria bacterium]